MLGDTVKWGSTYEAFEAMAKAFPQKTAILYIGCRQTFSELKEAVDRFAGNLHNKLGISSTSKVIIYISNTPQWLIAWLALQRLGALAIPISNIYTSNDLKYMANDSGAETILCMDTNFGYVAEAFPDTPIKKIIVTNMVELLPRWKRSIGRAFKKIPTGKFSSGKNIFTFKSFLEQRPSALPPFNGGEKLSSMLYTGGTLGFPKGVPFSDINILQCLDEIRWSKESHIPRGEDIAMQGGPFYHILGLGTALGPLLNGETLIIMPRMNLDSLLRQIEKYRVKSMFAVSTLFRMILEHDRVEHYDLSSFKHCMTGGDVVPINLIERWQNKFGKTL